MSLKNPNDVFNKGDGMSTSFFLITMIMCFGSNKIKIAFNKTS